MDDREKPMRRQQQPQLTEAQFRERLGLIEQGCRQNECPRNRDYDPFCLCRLEDCVPAAPKIERRQQVRLREVPAGLRNLGNTCYMNSYLQTLFHLSPVRRILFAWRRPPADQRTPDKRYDVVEELQRLLARLQSTQSLAVSPRDLVRLVGLNTARQNDVQEFSMLFLDWVDQAIAERKDEEKLQSLFTGRYRSIVRCRDCRGESMSEVKFADFGLQINEIEDVKGSLKLFFAEEQIDDYACERCAQKRVAQKRVQVIDLPRFLNLHFHRFFYDRDLQKRKKLLHAVSFPAVLDLRPFLSREQVDEWGEHSCCYELTAVLIHRGDAHGGHYFARIRVAQDGRWYTFDDDHVTPYAFNETNEADARGAYLLVYERQQDVERTPAIPEIPDYVDVREMDPRCGVQLRDLRRSLGETGLHRFLASMKVKPDSCIVFLPTDWLITVVRALKTGYIDQPIYEADLTAHLCPHHRLGNVRGLKAVDGVQAGGLIAALGAVPKPCHLDGSHFCPSCTSIVDAGSGSARSM